MNQSPCNSSDSVCKSACFTHLETKLKNKSSIQVCGAVAEILLGDIHAVIQFHGYLRNPFCVLKTPQRKKGDSLLFPKASRDTMKSRNALVPQLQGSAFSAKCQIQEKENS